MTESEDIRPAIGIDLGTTNSRVGIWLDEENRFELISNDHGNQSTPSYVAFTETERLIGDSAKDQVSRNPANTVFDAKRLIGRKFCDLGTDSDKMHIQWPFRVAHGVDDKPMIHVEYKGKEKVFSAEEVYSMILGKMKDLAEVYSGSVVNGASVSVPHCFNSAQRQATRNACSMAGLETVTLVNEPICAALAYTLNTNRPSLGEKKVMIFDLGGGSLDVTLFSIEEGVIEVKATSGDSELGGEDFDLRLLHYFIQEIKQKYERDITSHPRVVRRLKKQVERVKLALSSEMETSIQIDSLLEDFNFYSSISRACFEEMNMDLFGKCIKCVEECLQRAEMDKADVYEVVLIGGSSCIPKVQELLAEFFNDEAKLNTSINPDEAVVCGAAARSGISLGYKAFADYLVVDVTPMSLGLETVGGAMHVMHPRNSSIPKSSEQLFTTVHDDQPGIFIQVYEGENSQTCDNMLIATIELSGIPIAPRGVPQILVRFDVDAYGILAASAKDKTTGQKVEIYMKEVDIASSSVHHDDERRQRLPIQVYHPSSPSENPNDSSSSSGPHESSNTSESSPHEFSEPSPAYRSSIAMESRSQEFSEPPQAYESSNTAESRSQEFSELPPAFESSNTVESRSQESSEPSLAYESSNTVESRSQGFYEPPQAFESSNTLESRSQEFSEPSLAYESSNAMESRSQEFYEPPQAFESSKTVENSSQPPLVESRSLEFPEPPLAYGSINSVEKRPQEFPEPPQEHESNSTLESRFQEFSEPPQAYEPSNAVENRSQEFSEPPQAYESNSTSESRFQEFSEPPQAYEPSNAVENRSQEFSEPPQAYEPSNAMENRSQESSVFSPASISSKGLEDNTVEIRSEDISGPPQAHGEIKSEEFCELPQASGASNAVDSRSQDFSGPQAHDSSNVVESSSQISLVQKIIETVHVIAPISDFKTHKRECSTFIRRVNMLVPMFEELRDLELSLSEKVLTCFNSLEAALNTAKDLLLLCSKGSKLWLILEQRRVADQFSLLNSALVQALDKLPDSLGISDEVREQVDLVHNQLKRSKGLEDAVDAQLNAELISVLDETNERSPDELTRLAQSFKFDTESALRKESQALDGIVQKEPRVPFLVDTQRFDQIFGLLSDLRNLFPSEDLEQHKYSKPPQAYGSSNAVESSSQEFSAPPPLPHKSSNSLEDRSPEYSGPPQLHRDVESRSKEFSAPPPPPQAYSSSHSLEGRSLEYSGPPQVHEDVESRSQEFSAPPPPPAYNSSHSVEDRHPSKHSEGSLEYSGPPQLHRDVESRSKEFSAPPPPPQAYSSSHSLEGRSLEYSGPPQVHEDVESRSQEFSAPPPPPAYNSSHSVEDRHPSKHSEGSLEYSGPPQLHRDVESRSKEFSAPPPPPQAYSSSHSLEGRSLEYSGPPQVHEDVESRSQEFSAPPPPPAYNSSHSVEDRHPSKHSEGSLEYSGPPQLHRDVESRSKEFSAPPPPPQAYSSSHSLEGRSLEYSGPPQVHRDEESRSQEFSAPPQAYNSSNSSEGRSREFSEPPQVYRDVESRPQEYSAPPPAYKSSHSFEGRPPHEHSEAPPVYRPSKTFGGRQHEFSEPVPTNRSSSSSQSRSQEFPEYSSRPEFPEHSPSKGHIDYEAAYKAGSGLVGRPPEVSEPLSTHRLSSSSGSRRHEPSDLSPVYKSSNASESRRHDSSEQLPSWKSSSTSEVSSEEFSGSGTLRAHGGMEHPVSDLPELHGAATFADEPLNHYRPRAENARSASCPQIRTSDSFIEDVVKKYTWDQVLDMTNDLTSRQLGKGGFGSVYLGKLENEKEVAVKILDPSSQQGISEFLNEVNLLKRVNHTNLVRLLGYCLDERQVLIYEFAEEGSIWDHLQVGGKSLDWKQRLNIALQSACGLDYLHTGCSPRIIHRDIKSQNILLTKSMVAKVADFGLSKLGADQDNISKTHVTTMVKGTLGYLDPEYLKTGQLTEKSDVYSFGVVLLEIITGRKPIQNSDNQKIQKCFIGDWVEEHYSSSSSSSRGLKTVADPTLGGHYNPKALKLVVNIAKYCTQPSGSGRPEMTEVVRVLRKAQKIELDEKKSSSWLPFR